MRAVNDVGALVTGAEQAAARGDNASAERLLRQALSLQETSLGSQHPDVANTLNNLAILSEMNGKLIDAEACYRRAYAIAVATLPPTDPLVTTSRENLEEFCAAHGVTLKRPPAPGAASAFTARKSSTREASVSSRSINSASGIILRIDSQVARLLNVIRTCGRSSGNVTSRKSASSAFGSITSKCGRRRSFRWTIALLDSERYAFVLLTVTFRLPTVNRPPFVAVNGGPN